MNPPPLSHKPTPFLSFACVSDVVIVQLKGGKEVKGWYGHLSKTWWKDNNGIGQEIKQPVVGWKPIN